MQKITCRYCLSPEAILAIAGERSSQYRCQICGKTFEADHEPVDLSTQARPQSFALPAVGGLAAIVPVEG